MRAGLIPSRALQERRIVHERNEKLNTMLEGEGSNIFFTRALRNKIGRSVDKD